MRANSPGSAGLAHSVPENTPATANSAPSGTSSGLPESPSQGFSSAPAAQTRRSGFEQSASALTVMSATRRTSERKPPAFSPQPRARAGRARGPQRGLGRLHDADRREVDRILEREHGDVVGAGVVVVLVVDLVVGDGVDGRVGEVDVAEPHLEARRREVLVRGRTTAQRAAVRIWREPTSVPAQYSSSRPTPLVLRPTNATAG